MSEHFDKDVFPAELRVIRARRVRLGQQPEESEQHPGDLFGICFSGGGIRSATFNLGVLQGLASLRLLGFADYLSTVSGGGYIGSWLHGLWLRKAFDDTKYQDVEEYLAGETCHPKPAEHDPITFLRKYSNYLAPKPGLFAADAWTIFTVWLRNTLLNQIILFLVLAAVLILPLVIINAVRLLRDVPGNRFHWPLLTALLGAACLAFAVDVMSRNLLALTQREFSAASRNRGQDDDISIWGRIVAPVYTAASLLCILIACGHFDPVEHWVPVLSALVVLFAASVISCGYTRCALERGHNAFGVFLFALVIVVVCALTTGGLLALAGYLLRPQGTSASVSVLNAMTWGPPLTMLSFSSGVGLQVGLMGIDFPDSAREWYARTGAYMVIVGVVWTAAFAATGFAPMIVIWFFQTHLTSSIAAFFTWAGTTIAGFQAGKSAASIGKPPANSAVAPAGDSKVELIAQAAPPLAVIGLIIAISTLSFFAIDATMNRIHPQAAGSSIAVVQGFWEGLKSSVHDYPATSLSAQDNAAVLGAAFVLFLAGLALSARVNINEFSMNHFYKNRLVRCYLGASNRDRCENRFTGFDPQDDVRLADLGGEKYDGPYPILNSALNLNQGSELAWQERKATSFVFTPLYCGYKPSSRESVGGGYYKTKYFTQPHGPHLGTATAISGAAANPNWGYHTSPVTTLLMTVFNVRLGWWIGNTLFPEAAKSYGPTVALKYLLFELFGLTTEKTQYLNLSDGGHFENLGIYELLRRKCRFIIVGDGEQDENYVFESLGGAIRKARIDFGAEITISPRRIFLKEQLSTVHCATGKVRYQDGSPGTILYVKASLTGDESYDVTQYKKAHPAFPQDSTMNQFFTESQFESYRALGRHAVENIFARIVNVPVRNRPGVRSVFEDLAQYWLAPSTADPGAFTRHAAAYTGLLGQLRADMDLRFLDAEVLQGLEVFPRPAAHSPQMNRARLLMSDFLQLMENVYVDLNLEDTEQEEHPQNSGWMVLFRYWKMPGGVLDAVWQDTHQIYSAGFQRFYQRL